MPESDFIFPDETEESEWFDVPEIEIIEEAKVIEQAEDVSSPTLSDIYFFASYLSTIEE